MVVAVWDVPCWTPIRWTNGMERTRVSVGNAGEGRRMMLRLADRVVTRSVVEGERNARETRFRDTVARINFPSGAQLLSFWKFFGKLPIFMIYRGGTVIAPCWGEMGRYLGYRNIFKIQRSAELSSTLSIEFVNFFARRWREWKYFSLVFRGRHPFPEFRQFDALHPPFLLCSRCALLIYDSAYCSELGTQACYVIARRVTRQCTMGVASNGEGGD